MALRISEPCTTRMGKRRDATTTPTSPVTRECEIPITRLLSREQLNGFHREGTDRMIGYHVTHPSSDSPREMSIDLKTNRWRCWYHMAGGGLFELAVILSGICRCEDFIRPHDDEISIPALQGRKFRKAVQYCLDIGIEARSSQGSLVWR